MIRWTVKGAASAAALGVVLAICAAGVVQAAPDSKPGGRACFYSRDLSSWRAADRSTVYLRVHTHDIYELKLLGECPHIDWVEGIGLEHQGSPWICSGLDATLIVPQGSGMGTLRCPVSSVRKLTPDEVAALPRKSRP